MGEMCGMDNNLANPHYMQELIQSSGQGIDNLTYTLSKLLKQPVLVSSSTNELISTCSEFDFQFFNVKIENPIKDNNTLFFCHVSSGSFESRAAGRAIAPLGRIIGYIFLLFDKDQPDLITYAATLDYAASLYATHLQSRIELKKEQYKFRNVFLYDLLYGNLKRGEEIIATGKMWGWDFRHPHLALLFNIMEQELDFSQGHLMDLLSTIVEANFIQKYYKNSASIIRQNELAILIPLLANTSAEQKKELLDFADKILAEIRTTELKDRIACGIGQVYSDATELFRSYQEAKVSFELGRLLDIPVPFFCDLGLEQILYKHDFQDLKQYYANVLGALHKQDDSESSLIHLLEDFAGNQFDINKTAKATFLHPNTIRYRLNKIESILGKSLSDVNTRFDIIATLKIRRLYNMDRELD